MKHVCTVCYSEETAPRKERRGNILTELILWLFFLVPGILYSLWRHEKLLRLCRTCGRDALVPLDSPRAWVIGGELKAAGWPYASRMNDMAGGDGRPAPPGGGGVGEPFLKYQPRRPSADNPHLGS